MVDLGVVLGFGLKRTEKSLGKECSQHFNSHQRRDNTFLYISNVKRMCSGVYLVAAAAAAAALATVFRGVILVYGSAIESHAL